MTFHIIGIGNKIPDFTTEQQQNMLGTHTFSGGKRHYELVKDFLPKNHQWITIQSPMSQVFEGYEKATTPIIVFASGLELKKWDRNKLQKEVVIEEKYK